MTALAGFCQVDGGDERLLARMERALAPGDMHIERHLTDGFGVVSVSPKNAEQRGLIHVDETDGTVVAATGRLLGDDRRLHEAPAEYCLELYKRMGSKLADELNGSFVVVIYEPREQRLILITDWFSHHPLYYWSKDGLLFGTEVKALLQHPAVDRTPNPERLVEFLALQMVLDTDTYYDEVRQLSPASILTWDAGVVGVERYWEPAFTWGDGTGVDEAAERIALALRRGVRRSCGWYQRVGLMLSGGLDSRMLAAAVDGDVLGMTVHSAEASELRAARRVAALAGLEHVFVRVPEDYPLMLLQRGTSLGDGMKSFVSAQPLVVEPTVRQRGIQVLITGSNLDNYFSGKWLPRQRARAGPLDTEVPRPATLRDGDVAAYLCELKPTASYEKLTRVLTGCTAGDLRARLEGRMQKVIDEHAGWASDPLDLIDLVIASNMSAWRYQLNPWTVGEISGEGIVSCDRELIEAFLATRPEHRFNYRAYRRALRMLDPALTRVPYTATGVPVYQSEGVEFGVRLVKDTVQRRWRRLLKRLGRLDEWELRHRQLPWPPAGRGMCECPEMRAKMEDYLAQSRLADLGVISREGLREVIDRHISRQDNSDNLLAAWLTAEQWLRTNGQ